MKSATTLRFSGGAVALQTATVLLTTQHAELYKVALRRMQWQSASSGNVVMQIWLGKNMLGQSNNHEISFLESQEIEIIMAPLDVKRKMLGSIFPGKLISALHRSYIEPIY